MVVTEKPPGRPKSGRVWKVKQTCKTSLLGTRLGAFDHRNKSLEVKQAERDRHLNMKTLEREMAEEKKRKKEEARVKREEQQKRRMENEYKNSVYQVLKPEKLKGMSKKQLRNVKKTAMNKNGQVELVNLYGKQ